MSGSKAVDAAIIQRVLAGDGAAFAELVRRHEAAMHAVCVAILHNPADADDALQGAWISVHRSLAAFRADATLRTWLVRIAIREALVGKRRRRTMECYEDRLPSADDPAGDAQREQVAGLLADELSKLSARARRIIVLRDFFELTTAETGRRIGLRAGAVKVRLHRARKQLADRVRAREPRRELLSC